VVAQGSGVTARVRPEQDELAQPLSEIPANCVVEPIDGLANQGRHWLWGHDWSLGRPEGVVNLAPLGHGSGRALGSPRDPPKPRPSWRCGTRHEHERPTRDILNGMQPLRARVHNGRLKLDEPTDLPEGAEVPLNISDDWDDLDTEDRAALHREIATSIRGRRAGGPTFSPEEVLAELDFRQ
jgi:hypothetical protein